MIRKYKLSSAVIDSKPVISSPSNVEDIKSQLLTMDVNQLTAYSSEHDIDIGNATSQQGIYKKIVAHMEAVQEQ